MSTEQPPEAELPADAPPAQQAEPVHSTASAQPNATAQPTHPTATAQPHQAAPHATPQAAPQTTPQAVPERPRPRTSPIVWGAVVLAFCLYSAAQLLAPGSVDSTTFFIGSMIALGVLLLIVGLAVIVRNARGSRGSGR